MKRFNGNMSLDELPDEYYITPGNHMSSQQAQEEGFFLEVSLPHEKPGGIHGRIHQAIYWLNTSGIVSDYRALYDYDVPCLKFWFKTSNEAFEFKMRFG